MTKRISIWVLMIGLLFPCIAGAASTPVVTDSRIKTFVYSEYEVFRLVVHFGYQSHIKLAKNENVQTISLGDASAWQITPVENRIFIKPLQEQAHTNMTIITNKRTYQFDLQSKVPGDDVDDELVYMVRFFYPPESGFDANAAAQAAMPAAPMMPPVPAMPSMPGMPMDPMMAPVPSMPGYPAPSAPMDMSSFPAPAPYNAPSSSFAPPPVPFAPPSSPMGSGAGYNLSYSLMGPDRIAPLRVFDDGKRTYFEFSPAMKMPAIAVVSADNRETPVAPGHDGEFTTVDGVANKYALRSGADVVFVFNDSATGGATR